MVMIGFYVPSEQKETVKNSMFSAGAGKIGDYDCCSWETKGYGQFRPLEGSNPYSGRQDEVQKEEEWKVEMVVKNELIEAVIKAMKESHPYEEVAYHIVKMEETK